MFSVFSRIQPTRHRSQPPPRGAAVGSQGTATASHSKVPKSKTSKTKEPPPHHPIRLQSRHSTKSRTKPVPATLMSEIRHQVAESEARTVAPWHAFPHSQPAQPAAKAFEPPRMTSTNFSQQSFAIGVATKEGTSQLSGGISQLTNDSMLLSCAGSVCTNDRSESRSTARTTAEPEPPLGQQSLSSASQSASSQVSKQHPPIPCFTAASPFTMELGGGPSAFFAGTSSRPPCYASLKSSAGGPSSFWKAAAAASSHKSDAHSSATTTWSAPSRQSRVRLDPQPRQGIFPPTAKRDPQTETFTLNVPTTAGVSTKSPPLEPEKQQLQQSQLWMDQVLKSWEAQMKQTQDKRQQELNQHANELQKMLEEAHAAMHQKIIDQHSKASDDFHSQATAASSTLKLQVEQGIQGIQVACSAKLSEFVQSLPSLKRDLLESAMPFLEKHSRRWIDAFVSTRTIAESMIVSSCPEEKKEKSNSRDGKRREASSSSKSALAQPTPSVKKRRRQQHSSHDDSPLHHTPCTTVVTKMESIGPSEDSSLSSQSTSLTTLASASKPMASDEKRQVSSSSSRKTEMSSSKTASNRNSSSETHSKNSVTCNVSKSKASKTSRPSEDSESLHVSSSSSRKHAASSYKTASSLISPSEMLSKNKVTCNASKLEESKTSRSKTASSKQGLCASTTRAPKQSTRHGPRSQTEIDKSACKTHPTVARASETVTAKTKNPTKRSPLRPLLLTSSANTLSVTPPTERLYNTDESIMASPPPSNKKRKTTSELTPLAVALLPPKQTLRRTKKFRRDL